MLTSWHGNASCITGPLWGESTGHHWIPLTTNHWFRASMESCCQHIDGLMQERRNSIANALELSLSCTNPLTYKLAQSVELLEIGNTMMLWWHRYNVHILVPPSLARFVLSCHVCMSTASCQPHLSCGCMEMDLSIMVIWAWPKNWGFATSNTDICLFGCISLNLMFVLHIIDTKHW